MATMSTTTEGRRVYVAGDTYAWRDRLRSAGCHWDGDRKQWWIGVGKVAAIAGIVAQATSTTEDPTSRSDTPDQNARVKARASYKGQNYYVLAETRDGGKRLLAARNGQFQFWAATGVTTIVKAYGRHDDRTHRTEYPTLGGLMAKAARWRQMSDAERAEAREDSDARAHGEQCPCSGGACRCGTDSPCCMCW
jgi:hypothetical protein